MAPTHSPFSLSPLSPPLSAVPSSVPSTAAPHTASSSSLPPSSVPFLLSQLQSLRSALASDEDERRRLQEENTKLKYRVNILLRSLQDEERKSAGHAPSNHSSDGSTGAGVAQHSVSDVKHVLDKLAA